MGRKNKTIKLPVITGLIFVLFGITFWIISKLYCDFLKYPLLIEFLKNLGQSLLCLGTLTILVDIPDWRKYFGERLKEIVIDRTYLNTLNDVELSSIQVDIFKSIYKHSDLEKEGSFMKYMQTSIQYLVDSSYRENVFSNIKVEIDGSGNSTFSEHITYSLREVGGKMIDKIEWTWAKGEIEQANYYKVALKCPNDREINKDKCTCKDPSKCKNGKIEISGTEIENYRIEDIKNDGYKIYLKDLVATHDGIQVTVELGYTLKKNRMYFWSMVEPSKVVKINVDFPSNYDLDTFIGGLSGDEFIDSKNENSHTYNFSRDGWMLPRAGIALSFYEKQKVPNTNS
jgi:hypothetical protein